MYTIAREVLNDESFYKGLTMPAPVMHIVLSLLILPLLPDKDPKEFIVGASFPDIRYLGVIDRRKTHNPHPTWSRVVKEKSSFKAGMEFHALVDVVHDRYMAKNKIYSLLPNECQDSPYYLKFFEDMIVYSKVSRWHEIAGYFDMVLNEELAVVRDKEAIELWHNNIKHYIEQQPAPKTVQKLLDIKLPTWYGPLLSLPMAVNAQYIGSVLSDNLMKLFNNNVLCNYILDLYDQFPTMITGKSTTSVKLVSKEIGHHSL